MRKSVLAVAASASVFSMVVAGAAGATLDVGSTTSTLNKYVKATSSATLTTTMGTANSFCEADLSAITYSVNESTNVVTGATLTFDTACTGFSVTVTLRDETPNPDEDYISSSVVHGTSVTVSFTSGPDLDTVGIEKTLIDVSATP